MSYAVRKCANSRDPRDWEYLPRWQRWGTYMPPWQWAWYAPIIGMPASMPILGSPAAADKVVTGSNGDRVDWSIVMAIPIPEIGDLAIVDINAHIITEDQDAPGTDPLGNPYTLLFTGSMFISFTVLTTIIASWSSYYYLPPYDQVLVADIANTLPFPAPQFVGQISFAPRPFDVATFV